MRSGSLRAFLFAGAALLMVPAAEAYVPYGASFADRGGSAAELVARDSLLPPAAYALRTAILAASAEGGFVDKRDAAALAAFYTARDYQPVWVADGRLTDAALKLIGRIAEADTDGLDPAAFATPSRDFAVDPADVAGTTAGAEVAMGSAVLAYARQAYGGRVDPASISANIGYEQQFPDLMEVLKAVSGAADPVAALLAYNPPHEGFQRLRQRLAEVRAEAREAPVIVPEGKSLRLDDVDPRVAVLRQRLEVAEAALDPNLFDAAVDGAVKAFQEGAGLKADGIVGPRTVAALNGAAGRDEEAEIVANMEFWRWVPRDFGDFYVRVNIPDYTVGVYSDGQVVHTTRVIVGKTTNQTPVFSDEMEHIIVNPSWGVPASIAQNEMLPAARNDPSYFSRRGYQVFIRSNGRFRAVDPTQVDWRSVSASQVQIRQPPGESNALGNIKFMFPNPYSVYLHDTPSRSLFQRDYRALSHGCVRVMDPMGFADVILAAEHNDWTGDRLRSLIGGRERQVNLDIHIPVHLTYFTAWVDDAGTLQTRDDIYGHTAKVIRALGLGGTS